MLNTILVAALVLVQPAPRTDTTFTVQPGGRLSVDVFNGAVTVRGWDRDAIRVRASHGDDTRVVISRRGTSITVAAESRRPGVAGRVQYELDVPRSFDIGVDGLNVPVTVQDVNGSIAVSNVNGAQVIRGVSGSLALESVGGRITVERARGRVTASTTNQGIELTDVHGDIEADAVNGSILLRGVDAARVQASTVNGEVSFAGPIRDGGRYYFGTHNGRVTVALPEGVNASVSIAARTGSVESAFPVAVQPVSDGRFRLTLGTGSARVEIESFTGNVRLVRPPGR